jgi:hypothetical protein
MDMENVMDLIYIHEGLRPGGEPITNFTGYISTGRESSSHKNACV